MYVLSYSIVEIDVLAAGYGDGSHVKHLFADDSLTLFFVEGEE